MMLRTSQQSKKKMAAATNQSLIFSSCSLFMGSLFAYSASVQLNDPGTYPPPPPPSSSNPLSSSSSSSSPDWYIWLPLYASASAVNLLRVRFTSEAITRSALLILRGGALLLLKVVVEDGVRGFSGFRSLDMAERAVRETIGSGLVVISMLLQLKASPVSKPKQGAGYLVSGGGVMLAASSFGLCLYFFAFLEGDVRL